MLLIKLTCFDEPEYLIFRQNRPVARWSATEAWGNSDANKRIALDKG